MLIPKSILPAVAKCCSSEAYTYALNSVLVERTGEHKVTAVGSDGRLMLSVEWIEEPIDDTAIERAGHALDAKHSESARFLLSKESLKAIDSLVPTRGQVQPVDSCALVEESSINGTIKAGAMVRGASTASVPTSEGQYPDWRQVFPTYNPYVPPSREKRERGIGSEALQVADSFSEEQIGFDSITVALSPDLMSQLMGAIVKSGATPRQSCVRLTIPIRGDRPILVESQNDDKKATAVLMPMSID